MKLRSILLSAFVLTLTIYQSYGQKKIKRLEGEERFTSDTLNGNYIPKDLIDCIIQIENALDTLKRSRDPHMPPLDHYWQLTEGSRLSRYFNDHGIEDPLDMMGIVFHSCSVYKSESIEIKIDEQIWGYKVQKERQEKQRREEDSVRLDEYVVGDTVLFEYDILGYSSKRQQEMDMLEKCTAYGIVFSKNYDKFLIKVKVLETCDKRGIIYYDDRNGTFDAKRNEWIKEKRAKRGRIIKYAKAGEIIELGYHYWIRDSDDE